MPELTLHALGLLASLAGLGLFLVRLRRACRVLSLTKTSKDSFEA